MDAPMMVQAAEVRLEATATAGQDRLRINYEIRNNRQEAVYVFNKLTKQDEQGNLQVDPNRIYVLFDGKVAILSKQVIPVPEDKDVEAPEIPCVTRIEPGKSIRETVVVELPLAPWTPYQPAPTKIAPTMDAEVALQIGFFIEKPGTAKLATEIKTPRGTLLHFAPFNPANQILLKTPPFAFRVPVRTGAP
jgi:hypothetical protein